MSTLRCDGVQKSFNGVHALVDVSFQFPASGVLGIVGPNGAGKTTLLNVLTGFVRPDSGCCWLSSCRITGLQPDRIARMGVTRTFQDLRLIRDGQVLDNVLLACPNERGERLLWAFLRLGIALEAARNREEAMHWLGFVGLAERAEDPAGALSYGEQKLLSLACCLATGARILLLDEPLAGVHPELAGRIKRLLREIGEQGRLVVFIEHDLGAVREIANTVIVMDGGRIVAEGASGEVLDRPEIMEAYLE